MADTMSPEFTQGVDPASGGEQDWELEQICRKFDSKLSGVNNPLTVLDFEIGAKNFTNKGFTLYLQILSSKKKMIQRCAVNFDAEDTLIRQTVSKRDIVDGLFRFPCDSFNPEGGKFVVTFSVFIRKVKTDFTLEVEMGTEVTEQQQVDIPPKAEKKTMLELFPELTSQEMHGRNAGSDWEPPICAVECEKDARPGYNTNAAHEYEDTPGTLLLKVKEFARMLRASTSTLCYSGAGLSTSAGIADYATKAGGQSKINVGSKPKLGKGAFKKALPSVGHRAFCALANNDLVHNWIQQNHDGLPQKAGFPQHRLNEIHGAWYDPSNPVVPMSGSLRDDLYAWMEKMSEEATLCIAVGTSLSGMNADQVFEDQCDANEVDPESNLGGIIIGLQKTRHDEKSSLRIYSRIDLVMSLLLRELNVMMSPLVLPFVPDVNPEFIIAPDVFKVPYTKKGKLTDDPAKMIVWDLRDGTDIVVVDGPGKGFTGKINGRKFGHYCCTLPRMRQGAADHGKTPRNYLLGTWWAKTATEGNWRILPVVNQNAKLQSEWEAEKMNNVD